MQRITGVVQHYAWGDPTFIPNLLRSDPDGRPWAELWLGTHPGGPASLADGSPLSDLTGPLPYLLKVLAASEPLSLQTHPNAEQARDGFARGVYGDDQPKTELLCALTRFEALCGVRPVDEVLDLLDRLGLGTSDLRTVLAEAGPHRTIAGLLAGAVPTDAPLAACRSSSTLEAKWVERLADRYPTDPAVVATLLLHHVELRPGEAIRLPAGNLHAYLSGAGVELMTPSDNVVRAGLTVKPVDTVELLKVLDASPIDEPVLPVSDRFDLDGTGLALVRLDAGARHTATMDELAVVLDGSTWHIAPGDEFTPDAPAYVVTR